jgi:hypothetical protein
MCGPEPCTAPTPCGRCERGSARLATSETAARQRIDHLGASDLAGRDGERATRVLRVMPTTSD